MKNIFNTPNPTFASPLAPVLLRDTITKFRIITTPAGDIYVQSRVRFLFFFTRWVYIGFYGHGKKYKFFSVRLAKEYVDDMMNELDVKHQKESLRLAQKKMKDVILVYPN